MAERTLKSAKKVSAQTQTRVRTLANRYVGRVIVARTIVGTFTGCLLSVHPTFIRLRVYSTPRRNFIVIRIPFALILAIRLVRCSSCN